MLSARFTKVHFLHLIYYVNVGNQKVNLSLKSDVVSGGKTAQVGVKIPFGGR